MPENDWWSTQQKHRYIVTGNDFGTITANRTTDCGPGLVWLVPFFTICSATRRSFSVAYRLIVCQRIDDVLSGMKATYYESATFDVTDESHD